MRFAPSEGHGEQCIWQVRNKHGLVIEQEGRFMRESNFISVAPSDGGDGTGEQRMRGYFNPASFDEDEDEWI